MTDTLCEWYALCDNLAAGNVAHPILGDVPTCTRCANKHDMTLKPPFTCADFARGRCVHP